MYGNSVGYLTIYKVTDVLKPTSDKSFQSVYRNTGNHGDNWLYEEVALNSGKDFQVSIQHGTVVRKPDSAIHWIPGDLKTRKRTGTSCQIEIHFSIKTTEYLLKYTLFRFQIYVRAIVLITKHD